MHLTARSPGRLQNQSGHQAGKEVWVRVMGSQDNWAKHITW